MKYKGTLIVVKDCNRAYKFYNEIFGLELIHDNDGNMELSNYIYLQESRYWENFIGRPVISHSNSTEIYFEEDDIDALIDKLNRLYPDTVFVNPKMTHSWGQTVVRFYDLDGNMIEVGTPL